MAVLRSNYDEYKSPHYRVLSDAQLEEIHWASVEIMERIGIRFYDQGAIDLAKKGGAYVSDGNIVKIPSRLVEWALRTVPKRVVLCNRDGRRTILLEGHKSYFGTGSDCLDILDHRTGETRRGVLADVIEGMKICDYLPNIDFVMSMFIPSDVPVQVSDRYQMEAMLLNTKKPIVFVTHDLSGCMDAVEMAEVVAGGAEELRHNPIVACYVNVATALRHNKEALQKLLYLAEKRLPCIYVPQARRALTGPITWAGSMALTNASVLAGLVLSQLKREGAPIIFYAGVPNFDMKAMLSPYAGPHGRTAGTDLAHYYNLPIFGLAGASDSKTVDAQAGMEAALGILLDALSGSNLIHDVGYLQTGKKGSFELLVICDDMIGWVKRFMSGGLEVNDETLALDLIEEVGHDGSFLETEHTFRHYREEWYPNLIDRNIYERWAEDGKPTLTERANKRVREILESHQPEPLPKDVEEKVKAITRRAERRLVKKAG